MSSDLPGDPPLPSDPAPQPTPDPAIAAPADPAPPVEPPPPPLAEEPAPPPPPSAPSSIAPDLDPVVGVPDSDTNHPAPAEPPPPAVVASGKVIEARDTVIIIRNGIAPGEHVYEVNAGHDALPGHTATILEDGSVVLGNYVPPDPVIEVPSKPAVE